MRIAILFKIFVIYCALIGVFFSSVTKAQSTSLNQIHEILWDFDIDSRLEQAPLVIKVGDRVRFKYATGARHNVFFHDVVEVPEEKFFSCDMTGTESALAGFGAVGVGGIDSIELSPVFQQAGTRYFVCSLDRHCESGMKIAIEVVDIRLDMQKSSPKTKCSKCGRFDFSGVRSCCAPGGTWYQNCGNTGEPGSDHTWFEGTQACENIPEKPCPKCAMSSKYGKMSCCARGGAWYENCGNAGETQYDHTWFEGVQACENDVRAIAHLAHASASMDPSKCRKCGVHLTSGERSCCYPRGSWFNACGLPGDKNFQHTWFEGLAACRYEQVVTRVPPPCSRCAFWDKTGDYSCCYLGGAWYSKCGNPGDPKYGVTWREGLKACEHMTKAKPTPTTTTTTSTALRTSSTAAATDAPQSICPKCATRTKSGKLSCCSPGGAWYKNCGNEGDTRFDHTWLEGIAACEHIEMASGAPATPLVPVSRASSGICGKCGVNKSGKHSCCFRGGDWFENCGTDSETQFDHTWLEGIQACTNFAVTKPKLTPKATTITITRTTTALRTSSTAAATDAPQSICSKCGTKAKSGKLSCCSPGGAWYKNCGNEGDTQFDHTWLEGLKACEHLTVKKTKSTPKTTTTVATKTTTTTTTNTRKITTALRTSSTAAVTDAPQSICPKCGIKTKVEFGKFSCCHADGAWYKNCGNKGDTRFEHTWLEGIKACEHIEMASSAPSGICGKCGVNKKSGKRSCCFRGGDWFENCGTDSETQFDHTWLEGIQACQDEAETLSSSVPIVTTPSSVCPKCGMKKKSGKRSCCFSGGAWFKKCGDADDPNFDHSWMEGIQACEGLKPEAEAHAMVSLQNNKTLGGDVDQYGVFDVIFGTGDDKDFKSAQDYASTADLSVFVTVLLVAVQMLVCQKYTVS